MNKTLLLTLLSFSLQSYAAPEEITRVLKDSTTWVALELNEQSVFCTDRGYGNVQLKVSVPDLDWLAHFDHRVVGERVPCITGGTCSELLQPQNILDPNNKIVVAPIRVQLSETIRIDYEAKTCERALHENITSEIRGRRFSHYRGDQWQSIKFEICEKEVEL